MELMELIKDSQVYNEQAVCIWGTGATTAMNQKCIEREKMNVKYFVDNNLEKRGKHYRLCDDLSIPIIHPDDISNNYNEFQRYLYLVSSANLLVNRQILNQIEDLGLKGMNFEEYILKKRHADVMKVYNLLEDEFSKKTFYQVLKARMLNQEVDEEVVCSDQYFCIKPFLRRNQEEIFVDVGGYVGDTVEAYIEKKESIFKKIYCFEPDSHNFAALKERKRRLDVEWGLEKEKIEIINCGIGKEQCFMTPVLAKENETFLGALYQNSRVKKKDEIEVTCIDDFFKESRVDFIKADIESHEYDMLVGGEKVIVRDNPLLAISVYHSPADFLDIPILLNSFCKKYKFALRHHTYENCETILYAYPA